MIHSSLTAKVLQKIEEELNEQEEATLLARKIKMNQIFYTSKGEKKHNQQSVSNLKKREDN